MLWWNLSGVILLSPFMRFGAFYRLFIQAQKKVVRDSHTGNTFMRFRVFEQLFTILLSRMGSRVVILTKFVKTRQAY